MSPKRIIILTILTWLIISTISVEGQNISTVGEIYDFEIGDIFHYNVLANEFSSITNIEILDHFYSQNNDTIFYVRDIAYKEQTPININGTFKYYIDTVYYSDLDSLINSGFVDTVYTDTNFYNGRIINQIHNSGTNHNWTYKYVLGCGQAYYHYHGWDGSGGWWELDDELVYFNKNGDEWGIPEPVSIEDNEVIGTNTLIFPNPTKNFLYIKHPNPKITYNIELRNLYGQLVKEEKNIQSPHYTINVSDLKPGVYFYVVKVRGEVVQQGKVIKK